MKFIDLNADLGEGGENDEDLMAVVSSANIACGGHAGDRDTMLTAVALAQTYGVAIGAHPGYEDRIHFGRKELPMKAHEVTDLVKRQIEALAEITPEIHHVKPHGGLYHQANNDPAIADAVVRGITSTLTNTLLYCPPHGELIKAANNAKLRVCPEGFIDRSYQPDGQLTPRNEQGAVIEDVETAIHQMLEIVLHHQVTHRSNGAINLPAETLCVHGDTPVAVQLLVSARRALEQAGFKIQAKPLPDIIG